MTRCRRQHPQKFSCEDYMRIPDSFLHTLRDRIDILTLVQERIPLKKMGANYSACCPFHGEKTPSFTVSPEKQFFHCFGCGAHGDIISFVSKMDGLTFTEAVQKLADYAGLPMPESSENDEDKALFAALHTACQEAALFYKRILQTSEGKAGKHYLQSRGLKSTTIEQFGLGYAPASWDALTKDLSSKIDFAILKQAGLILEKNDHHYDRFRHRIMFPIHNTQGHIIGFGGRVIVAEEPKYLNSPETPLFHKGQALYGLYHALQHPRLPYFVVVEGYMDVLSLVEVGILGAVATLGTAITTAHLKRLYQANIPIIFCFDADTAGQKAAWRALEMCLPVMEAGRDIRFMILPKGEDPDSWIRRSSKTIFEVDIQNAKPLSAFLFDSLLTKFDRASIEGRAHFLTSGKKLLSQLPTGVYHTLMLDKLHDLAGAKRISPPSPVRSSAPISSAVSSKTATPLAQKAFWLLFTYPQWFPAFTGEDWEIIQALPDGELLAHLFAAQSQGQTVETWRAAHPHLIPPPTLMAWLSLLTPEVAASEWQAIVAKLRQGRIQHQIESLLQKAQASPLSLEEKTQLKYLLSL